MKGELYQLLKLLNGDYIHDFERKKWDVEAAKKVDGKWHLIIAEQKIENENMETNN